MMKKIKLIIWKFMTEPVNVKVALFRFSVVCFTILSAYLAVIALIMVGVLKLLSIL